MRVKKRGLVIAGALLASAALVGCTDPVVQPTSTATSTSASPSVGEQTLLRPSPPQREAVNSDASEGLITTSEATSYITWVIQDADKLWTNWMLGRGFREPYVQYFIIQPGTVVPTKTCSLTDPRTGQATLTYDSAFPNALYCPNEPNGVDNGIIVLPVETMAKIWSGEVLGRPVSDLTKVGDFAAATIVAHEFGHHIRDELGIATGTPKPDGKNNELIADCFAGVFATAIYADSRLEEGDLDEAMAALAAIGDQVPNGPDPHGTAEERVNAFKIGIYGTQADPRGGVPGNCLGAYWPAYTGAR